MSCQCFCIHGNHRSHLKKIIRIVGNMFLKCCRIIDGCCWIIYCEKCQKYNHLYLDKYQLKVWSWTHKSVQYDNISFLYRYWSIWRCFAMRYSINSLFPLLLHSYIRIYIKYQNNKSMVENTYLWSIWCNGSVMCIVEQMVELLHAKI